jgi:uncharacterized protein (DUF885 family)
VDNVADLARDYWDLLLAHHPIYATMIGDRRFDEEVPDVSAAAEERFAADLRSVLERAEDIDRGALSDDDAVSLAVLEFDATNHIADIEARLAEFTVSPMFGPPASLLRVANNVTVPEPEHADALVTRHRRIGNYLDGAADRLRAGVATGRTPPRIAVDQVVQQIDGILATAPEATPFVVAPVPPDAWDETRTARWRDDLTAAARDILLPAFARYRDCLAEEVSPHARPPERSGLTFLPDGEEVYATQVRQYTTIDRPADEVHRIGLAEIDALAEEYLDLAGPLFDTSDVTEILTRLRDDPDLRFSSSEEVFGQAQRALQRAQEAVPEWFGVLPATDCVIREMDPHEAEHGTLAYYIRPSADGSRPGSFYVNTHHPETRTRYESEALAFHESVPGHHLQIALAQERDDLPAFRRHGSITAYVEGWALYTERLADEMALYTGDVERLGMLSFDSWRAGRLVVDTGIHQLGWSRQQAIDFLLENSPQAENNITNEVDRYIAWPGQALAYKIGQREIVRLRIAAQAALGADFDIRAFHDRVLTPGPVPLGVLDDLVHAWIDEHEPGP